MPQLKSNLAEVEAEERAAVLDADSRAKVEPHPASNVEDLSDDEHKLSGGAPGELQHSLMKLKQFRHFYIVVVVYIYFTRIVVYFVDSTVCHMSDTGCCVFCYSGNAIYSACCSCQ